MPESFYSEADCLGSAFLHRAFSLSVFYLDHYFLQTADQRHPESYFYDITAQAAGYYREHSADVPVFPNITSMQNFDLIPLPAGADEPLPDGDITFYNDMQQY